MAKEQEFTVKEPEALIPVEERYWREIESWVHKRSRETGLRPIRIITEVLLQAMRNRD